MSFAIQWGDEAPENAGFVYFDAVTAWQQTYSGQVTKHPIDGGGNISDHYIRDNPVFTLSGVISSVDVSTNAWPILGQDLTQSAYNSKAPTLPVSVLSTDKGLLNRFIPNSIGQLLPDRVPDVFVDISTGGQEVVDAVKAALTRLIYSGKTYNDKTEQFDSVMQTVTIYEYDGTTIVRKWPEFPTEKIVMTNIVFKEDVGTGEGLYCDVTFEQVEFAYLQKTKIPKKPATAVKKKVAAKANAGKCDSTVKDTSSTANGNGVSGTNTDPDSKKDRLRDVAGDIKK